MNRVAKVVKGGKRLRFTALVVVGDGRGQVGAGLGKAGEVATAIKKAGVEARKDLGEVCIYKNTVPHDLVFKYGAARIMLKPAVAGTGIVAGATAKAVMEAAGVTDVLTKSLGSSNPVNLVRCTILALRSMRIPDIEVAKRTGGAAAGA